MALTTVGALVLALLFAALSRRLLLGIPVYLAQRRHLTPPQPVSPYR
jgi:hypothetical protein